MRLRELRAERHYTQKQVADATGISIRAIKNYEGNLRKPTYDILIALADYFDVSLDYFTGRSNDPKIYP